MRGALVSALGAVAALGGCITPLYDRSVRPYEYSGARLYQVFCSSCHGLTGHGDGPVQPFLRRGVPDLTGISARNGGKFPEEKVRGIIDGRENLIVHGTAAMPVWGFEFHAGMSDEARARERADRMVDRLTGYLKTLQPGYYD